MPKRERLKVAKTSYFVSDKPDIQFVPSGCTLLDCALGGGWALSRVANIVGDKSTAKTALATEAIINFLRVYPNGKAAYRDAESAFDRAYGEAMGLPLGKVDFGSEDNPFLTVEDFARDVNGFLDGQIEDSSPGIYVLDSLDALSDEAEMKRDLSEGTYGTSKAKQLSGFFRTMTDKVERSNTLLLIISQVRDNIGARFGEKHKRSGGRALDFYASQILWLSHMETLKKTIAKVARPIGIVIKAKCKKNKIALPFREAEFSFMFGYGIEDAGASIDWLETVGRLTTAEAKTLRKNIETDSSADYAKLQKDLAHHVKGAWAEIETTFLPKRAKYA
jgi:recombination protein RecA